MTDISCSNGDLSSTPSNRSEYFSVTSSLNILNSNDEVYHSLDEELPNDIQCESLKYYNKKSEHHKIVKQNHLEIEDKFNLVEAMIIESENYLNIIDCEILEKEIDIKYMKSRDSINSYEDEYNMDSTLSKTLLTEYYNKESFSDNDLSISDSANNTAQLNTSHIEGELSDINDIIYDSSISPMHTQNLLISKENNSSDIEADNNDLSQSNNLDLISSVDSNYAEIVHDQIAVDIRLNEEHFPILAMVRQMENQELEIETNKKEIDCRETNLKNFSENDLNIENIQQSDFTVIKNESLRESSNEQINILKTSNKKSLIENVQDSPIKKSYLCCSIRRKRKKESPKLNFIQKFRARHIFSFLKSSNSSKKLEKEVVSEPINNSYENPISIKSIGHDYDGIPFIDADVIIDTEAYITLAKQELFLE